jgi:hypothetical protein
MNGGPDLAAARRLGWLGVVAASSIWLVAAIWGSGKGYYPCYDSGAYVTVARAMLAGEGYVEGNHPEKPPFILYPPGYSLPLAGGMALFGEDWRALRLATTLPFALSALLLVPWAFGRRLPPWQWPIAVLVIGFGSVFTWSLRIQAEAPYLFWTMLTVGFADRALAKERVISRESLLAVLFGVVAIWTKPMGLVLPFVVAAEGARVAHVRFHGSPKGAPGRLRRSCGPLLVALLVGVVVLVPFAVHLSRVQPDALDPAKSHVLQKNWWDPDAGQRSFFSADNARHLWQSLQDATFYYVPWSFLIHQENNWSTTKNRVVASLGWLVGAGLLRRLLRREWDGFDWLVLGQLGLIGSMPNQHPRYYMVVAPALSVSLLGGLSLVGEVLSFPLRKLAPALPARLAAAFVLLGVTPLLAYEARDLRDWRDWGEAWSDRSLNVFIGQVAAERANPGDVLLVDDHYGIHALTGFLALSYHPAQRKSMTGYNVEEYLARGGRVDVVASQVGEWEMAKELFERHGWQGCDIDETDWWISARLRRRSDGPCPDRSRMGELQTIPEPE